MAVAVPWLLLMPTLNERLAAGAVFIVASLTDSLDGYLARRYQWITALGKIVDPAADKLLVLGTIYTFAHLGMFPLWIFVVLAAAELAIVTIGFYYLYRGVVPVSVSAGKAKMTIQVLTMLLVYVNLLYQTRVGEQVGSSAGRLLQSVMNVAIAVALVATLNALRVIIRNARAVFSDQSVEDPLHSQRR
jgi:CDP-diacylglycerol--glycerol-3-phosphate 3-phosphatidyltransferase